MIVFLTSNKRGTVAIELHIMGSGRYWPCEVNCWKQTHKLAASKDIGLEKLVNIHVMWRLQVKITAYRWPLNCLTVRKR